MSHEAKFAASSDGVRQDWSELLAGGEALTAAILDRLLYNAHVINIKGCSYRLRDLDQTLGARQG